ncbi:ankyrin repeat domain-containing protein [Stenotrophomonas sp. ZAC14D2_NAIMI4_7]|uniref:ankyrin repeat domain-containing protein n=1 Tax=Stenotrophomonas sp. ZAC14D2_NAIMI4_7 TaxID=2072405 RepID=UPI00131EE923|nr:ankyrin repeat domain-containing protein [Stenotrophomonas sp. ZAC14D2_NAIMI4_7]
MDCHPLRLTVSLLILAAALAMLPGCSPQSMHGAEGYFDGKALQLAIAAEGGDSDAIRHLVKDEGVDPDKTFSSRDGIPLIAWPLRARSIEGLKALLDAGANPNTRESKQMNGQLINFDNAMVYAAKMDDARYLDLLLKHGGNPDTRNINNETLLYQAFISGNQWKNVQTLVENGADVNESNRRSLGDDTVLSWYTGRGGFDYAYWLLEHGADPTISQPVQEGSGRTARQLMVEDIYWEITTPDNLPWQKKCQQWLADRNIPRPPMPEHIRRKREAFKFPSREEDIPLL